MKFINSMSIFIASILFCASLSFSAHDPVSSSQSPGSEVFLFSIQRSGKKFDFKGGKNITANPGYDNQPAFTQNNQSILYTSGRDGKEPDIYEYFLSDGHIEQITFSEEGEYSPRAIDKNTLTYVREGKDQSQTVWKLERDTKIETSALKNKEPVGYYAWNNRDDGLVWIRYAYTAHWVNPSKGINEFVASYVQAGIPHHIPGTQSFSFMQRQINDELWIKAFNPATRAIRPIVMSKDGKKDYCWMPDGSLLIGSGEKLFRFVPGVADDWKEIADLNGFGIKDISRLAVSSDGKMLALVSNQ